MKCFGYVLDEQDMRNLQALVVFLWRQEQILLKGDEYCEVDDL